MKLLFITQKIHSADDDLAFTILWVKQFIRAGFEVEVICLEKGAFDDSFPVHSLGKESGVGKLMRTLRFFKLIFGLQYDRVFVHMNPEYFTLGGWWWWLRRVPVYFWYTHYTMSVHVWLAGHVARRLFAATPQSLPQYEGNPKKVVLGHGIDIDFWLADRDSQVTRKPEYELLMVHRLSRSKRVELGIEALAHLPQEYRLTIYGRDIDPPYAEELRALVKRLGLTDRVSFSGPVPMRELKAIYPQYRVMVNMASETIDKTMLEAMVLGVYPVTTQGNSIAIGLPAYPVDDNPETIAQFILDETWKSSSEADLLAIVRERHSLPSLVGRMSEYIKSGT